MIRRSYKPSEFVYNENVASDLMNVIASMDTELPPVDECMHSPEEAERRASLLKDSFISDTLLSGVDSYDDVFDAVMAYSAGAVNAATPQIQKLVKKNKLMSSYD